MTICRLTRSKVKVTSNWKPLKRSRPSVLHGAKFLLLEHNKLTLAGRGPYKVVGKIGNVDYKVEVEPRKVKTYHINMLKQYFRRREQDLDSDEKDRNNMGLGIQSEEGVLEQAAAIACIIEDNSSEEDTESTVKDADLWPLYNVQQKETVDDVDISSIKWSAACWIKTAVERIQANLFQCTNSDSITW